MSKLHKGIVARLVIFAIVSTIQHLTGADIVASLALLVAAFAYLRIWENNRKVGEIVVEMARTVEKASTDTSGAYHETKEIVKELIEVNEILIKKLKGK